MRESVPATEPTDPLKAALAQSPEVRRLLAEHFQQRAANALHEIAAARSTNNPLALAGASGKYEALFEVVALCAIEEIKYA